MRTSVFFIALIQEFRSSSVSKIQSWESSNFADSSFSLLITCWLCDWSTVTKSKANNYTKNTYVRPCGNKSENMTEPCMSRYRLLRLWPTNRPNNEFPHIRSLQPFSKWRPTSRTWKDVHDWLKMHQEKNTLLQDETAPFQHRLN